MEPIRSAEGRLVVIGLKGLDRVAVTKYCTGERCICSRPLRRVLMKSPNRLISRQPPGDMVVLSFADSDLAALAAAWELDVTVLPSLRLAHLRDLRHPDVHRSLDRSDRRHAKVILVRLLGGLDWWGYGIERLSALARKRGIVLAVLPGEDRDDPRLRGFHAGANELDALLEFFREGGRENLRGFCDEWHAMAGAFPPMRSSPLPVPRMAAI